MPLQTPDDDRRPADSAADRLDDELLGLDPTDPEVRAFAEHLERQQRVQPSYTVEGYITGMGDFAASANRLGGHRKLMASLLALLILLGVIVAAWDALVYVVTTFTK
ncbi:hypothetical protein BLA60_06095 [Actinophytocola xinjiangensis]|uniref:Uncharacterized protein n=1 Tax=Actinophytocola xinjiangensis TaxID=485602 RepID=A0A7Z0WQ20_9PSEU|nr:hypothetical protein [Actinophytocola xinjiangensis]OLF12838.1 hypothetical protein BLA60_06095 [Actinophytocola xinjiangensis]